MSKIKVICTSSQEKKVKQLIRLGYATALLCDCIYNVDIPMPDLDDFEFVISKGGEQK